MGTGLKMIRDEAIVDKRLERLSCTLDELYQRASKNEQILRRYQSFELKLLSIDTISELIDMLIVGALKHFDLTQCELWLVDSVSGLLDILPAKLPESTRLVPESHLPVLYAESIHQHNEARVTLVDWQFIRENLVFSGQEMGSAALLPLMRAGKWIGSLHFGARSFQRFTKDMSTDFMHHLGILAAVAIENAINREQLHRLSLTDALTGVANRRAFHTTLEKEISLSQRRQEPLSLFLIDLDHFKQINDTYGHQFGDKVLVHVSRYISKLLRKSDHVCRYGGEEFALILPNCDRRLAIEVAERIRQQVSELAIWHDKGERIHLTLSIGLTCWQPNSSERLSGDEFLRTADKAVYSAKAEGRNCVRYNELIL